MRFNYKEIPDYKFVFENGEEFLLDTLKSEQFEILGEISACITDALFNEELIKNLAYSKLKEVIRIVPARDEITGKDFDMEYVIKSPICKYSEITSAKDNKYHTAYYSIHTDWIKKDSEKKFEIRKNL